MISPVSLKPFVESSTREYQMDNTQFGFRIGLGTSNSPLLFNLYSKTIFRGALDGVQGGIKINGISITNIRYADDTVIIADDVQGLQSIIDSVVHYSEMFGLHLNGSETKLLVFFKTRINAHLRFKERTSDLNID